jgi:hypothetical protein
MEINYIGYSEQPPNGNDVRQARTTMQVRSWRIPRKQKSLQALIKEMGTVQYPGVYILFEKTKAYVGEAEHFPDRLNQHMTNPDDKIKGWTEVLVISDGRPMTQSVLNNKAVRQVLEAYLNELLKANKFDVVASVRSPTLDPSQQCIVNMLLPELYFFLEKQGVVTKPLEEKGQEQVYLDELKDLFKKKCIPVKEWTEKEAVLENGEKVFIRPGSLKPKGWQVTIRGKMEGSFIDCARKGEGYLLVPRDGVLYIPLNEIQNFIPAPAFELDTVDIFIVFTESEAKLIYHEKTLDVTKYKLL